MSKIKTNIKMRVTPKQSRKVQEICFGKGVDWLFTKNTVKLTDKPFLIIRKSRLTYLNISQEKYFNEDENEEVYAELFIRTNGTCTESETIKDKKMRDIKFRAWDEQNKIMHNEVEFIRSGTNKNDWILFKSDKQKLEQGDVLDNPYFQQQIKVMQFTGLFDKQGVEIYEGDIVYLSGKGLTEIEFPFIELYQAYYENDIGTIKGNIYENPELI